ncbi:von Willebrand factor type A domain-containing protein [Alphaproteobacteria bacterium KMM 3653]|uniref:von Willebrand factor type A domain-containing protein n=1 Tax=Harenicola maris TaxID=2841044 RepID=A0AAP2G9S3_9RHOB|nr:von Willebrand factor type A domain-containing protein [Harenicola maris]
MTDPLDDLKTALKGAPAPDSASKAAHLRAAMAEFDGVAQGNADALRQTSEAPGLAGRIGRGISDMFDKLTSKAGLTATSGIVAVAVAAVVFVPGLPGFDQGTGGVTAPEAEVSEFGGTRSAAQAGEAPDLNMSKAAHAESVSEPEVIVAETEDAAPVEEAGGGEGLAAIADLAEAPAVTGRGRPEPLAAPAPRVSAAPKLRNQAPPRDALRGGAPSNTSALRPLPVPPADSIAPAAPETEAFANEAPNPVKVTVEEPVSTFSIDVDTASYTVVRQSIMSGRLPPKEAVRVEEMVNYFPYDYAGPEGEHPFAQNVTVMQTPWNADTQLVHVALQGEMPALEDRPPLNLVFLIDSSGSMNSRDKLPLLKQSLRLMLPELRPEDQVAIVAYAGSSGLILPPTAAGERSTILAALDRISAGGSTAGQAGLQQAYAVAEEMTGEGEVSRVLLATDGDFNVGLQDPDALKEFIAEKRDSGTYLSVLGFGRGNLDDATMQALAQNGNGQAGYIDTLSEARKVLVDQLTGALFPIAGDVKVQVEFNPAEVAEYRLIGYETRALKREDFNNDKVDAGDIGAGHSVTALYEVTPVGSPAILNDPLRYGQAVAASEAGAGELGFLRLRYKEPGEETSQLIETPIASGLGTPDTEVRFSAAIAGFGQLLRGSDYLRDWGYAEAIALATEGRGADAFGYRAEAIQLMRLAEALAK